MVKAADIGKGSRDFVSKDFFAGNEVKVNQGGVGKNTTTFKIGDSIKADHKIDLNKVPFPFTEPWSTFDHGPWVPDCPITSILVLLWRSIGSSQSQIDLQHGLWIRRKVQNCQC